MLLILMLFKMFMFLFMFSLMFLLLVIFVMPPFVPLSHAFLDVFIACDFCHAPSCLWLLCDAHVPLTSSPMAPSHDVPLACAFW
jgi:hypothetical protein